MIFLRMVSLLNKSECSLEEELATKDRLLLEKEQENGRLRHRIKLLEKALFGPRTERILNTPDGQGEFEDLLAEVQSLSDQLADQEKNLETEKPKRKNKSRRSRRNLEDLIPDDLPREEIFLDLPEEDKICLETGEPLVRIGEDISKKLAYKPGSYYLKVFIRPKFVSRSDASQGVLSCPMPHLAIPGSHFDESFLAGVVVDKCAYHLPLYRQEERLHHQGIDISRQTLSRLYIQSAKILKPIYELIKNEIFQRKILFTDDTPVKLRDKDKGKSKTGRMWVYIGGGVGPPYRVFEFTIDRCKDRPKKFLTGFQGYIHADAYRGYDDLFAQDGVFECGCWMHVRRKFVEADDAPASLRNDVLRAIRNLYRYEQFIRERSHQVILAVRKEKIEPLIDGLFSRTATALTKGEVLPSSSFAKALGYMHNLGDALKTFIGNPYLKPDNGLSERAIRPLTIGRKNWLFVGSKSGGDATGILLSIIQSCRIVDIDPFTYINDVLRRINDCKSTDLKQLLPHNWKPGSNGYQPKNCGKHSPILN